MGRKICSKCKGEKEVCEFNKYKNTDDGLMVICRECVKIKNKMYRERDPLKYKESQKKYRDSNKDKEKNRISKWRNDNKNKVTEYNNEYHKSRKKNDLIYKLRRSIKNRVYLYMKVKNITKQNKTFDIVGCTPKSLKEHLEKQFKDNMNWDNYGLYGWHIDHIIPLSSAKTEEEIYKLCHYTNLQPLWAEENLKKSNKL